jgi:hypothetical protein
LPDNGKISLISNESLIEFRENLTALSFGKLGMISDKKSEGKKGREKNGRGENS